MSPANSGTNTNNADGLMGWFTRLMSRHIRATRRKLGGHLAMSRPRHRTATVPGPGPRMCPVSRLGPVAGDLWDELSAGHRGGDDGQ